MSGASTATEAPPGLQVRPLGDAALTAQLDAAPGPATTSRLAAMADGVLGIEGVAEVAASFASLTVFLTSPTVDRAPVEAALREAAEAPASSAPPGRDWRLPVCVAPEHGPDQEEVAGETGLAVDAVIERLLGARLTVLAVGFLPGFGFLGPAPEPLALKRKASPRLRVPKGSVAVANGLAGIYPWESPGGWRILGASAAPLFDPARARPAMLAPGDRLSFEAVGAEEHSALAKARDAGELDPERFAVGPS